MRPSIRQLAVLTPLLAAACANLPETGERVTPQRPTFSSSPMTVAKETVELEGGLFLGDGGQIDSPMRLKYGYDAATEVFLQAAPLRRNNFSGSEETGFGDVSFGIRGRVREETEEEPSLALGLEIKLPVADHEKALGSGETDVLFSGSMGKQIDKYYVTGYYELGLLGEVGDGGIDIGHGLAVAGSMPARDDLSAYGELAGIFIPEADVDALFTTWGVAYTVAPYLVFDVGLQLGLSDDANDFALLVGFTRNFGHFLWQHGG
jgi:hypothetical protein